MRKKTIQFEMISKSHALCLDLLGLHKSIHTPRGGIALNPIFEGRVADEHRLELAAS